ncbi:MAG TPA: RNA polymerase factor sigma-32 [Candidatus Binataceae bacterium]|nr:RNA polymerase factor sigma-32 [Candidatus Binataceae bacterium]
MARKSLPRKPPADHADETQADQPHAAARATRRRRRNAREESRGQQASQSGIVPEIVDDESPEPTLDLGEAGDLPEGFARPRALDETVAEGIEPSAPAGEPGEDGERGGESGALVPFDPLGRYLAEIRRFPLLSREEESEIAKRYAKHHDPADAYRLVTANLRLVVKIASEFAHASRNLLDLIQEGNVGLMEAVRNFDPYRGIRFPSYAVWWVRAYIYRFLINNWRLVKIGTTQAQRKLFFNLRKETERLEAEGFAPQPLLLAQRMGVKESEVREMQERMAHSEVSLDQPVREDEDVQLLDVIPDTGGTPEEAAAEDEWRSFAHEKIDQFARTLRDKELEIFQSRLLSEDPPTLQEVGARFGISRERVRQIESRLKKRLKTFLKSQASDIDQAGP